MLSLQENINKTRTGKRVLVAPLDWGLGHATRCIPVIRELLQQGFTVFIAAEKGPAALLQSEFPGITILPLKGYNVSYSKKKFFFFLNMILQTPKIVSAVMRENRWLKKIIDEYKLDIVISDNRYGLYSEKVKTIFITHQLSIKTGSSFSEKIAQQINYGYIRKYNECWVPDVEGVNSLAGELSHPKVFPQTEIKYIGPLTRFRFEEKQKDIDLLFIISGPEPQRTLLEKKFFEQAKKIRNKKIVLVRGLPGVDFLHKGDFECCNHLPAAELNEFILRSKLVISRSGYSTVMDLAELKANAVLIPTPGQTEQEYLAKYLSEKKCCITVSQEEFDLEKILSETESKSVGRLSLCESFLETAIASLQ